MNFEQFTSCRDFSLKTKLTFIGVCLTGTIYEYFVKGEKTASNEVMWPPGSCGWKEKSLIRYRIYFFVKMWIKMFLCWKGFSFCDKQKRRKFSSFSFSSSAVWKNQNLVFFWYFRKLSDPFVPAGFPLLQRLPESEWTQSGRNPT